MLNCSTIPHRFSTYQCRTHNSPTQICLLGFEETGLFSTVVFSKLIFRQLSINYTSVSRNSPETSTISPGTISLARTFCTPDLSPRITLPISGSYSLRASMADSAFLSWKQTRYQMIKKLKIFLDLPFIWQTALEKWVPS